MNRGPNRILKKGRENKGHEVEGEQGRNQEDARTLQCFLSFLTVPSHKLLMWPCIVSLLLAVSL